MSRRPKEIRSCLPRLGHPPGAHHIATYSGGTSGTISFTHADWLGTERIRTDKSGNSIETCVNLPFGDGQSCSGSGGDPSPLHFTGKQRDTETNLDDFGARYFNSGMARWVTPDWSARPEGVPYADLALPQSLNLYAYVGNNPVTHTDPDGHISTHAWSAFREPIQNVDVDLGMDASGGSTTIVDNGYSWGVLGIVGAEAQPDAGQAQQTQTQNHAEAFEAVWNAYPTHEQYGSGQPGTSGQSIQQLTGVDVVDTCALRMSYALNQAGFTIGKNDGSAWKGKDGQYYLVRLADVEKFITKTFGLSPQSIGKSNVVSFAQTNGKTSGFVGFSIHFRWSGATGHVALFRNGSFRDPNHDDYTTPDPAGRYVVRGIDYWRMQ